MTPHASIPVRKDTSWACQDPWDAMPPQSGQSSLLHVNVSWGVLQSNKKINKRIELQFQVTIIEPALMCFWWSCRPQWFSVSSCLVQTGDPWSVPTLWAPPATSPPVCSPATKAMCSLPRLTLLNVERQDFGIIHNRSVLVRLHFMFLSLYLRLSLWVKSFMILLKRLLLTSSFPSSVLQLSSAPLSGS